MWFKKKQKEEVVQETLPAIHFYLIDGDKIRIQVEWPEENFSPTAFGNLLSRIVSGIPPMYLEKPIETFINNSESATSKQLGFTFIEKLKGLERTKSAYKSDTPLVPPDRVTHYHFSQNSISVQHGE